RRSLGRGGAVDRGAHRQTAPQARRRPGFAPLHRDRPRGRISPDRRRGASVDCGHGARHMSTGLIRVGEPFADPREREGGIRNAWIWQLSLAAVVAIVTVFTSVIAPQVL